MKKRIKTWARSIALFFKLLKPHFEDRSEAIAEDLRKVGTYAIGLSLVAGVVAGDKITDNEAVAIFVTGIIIWLVGVSLSRKPKED